MFSQISGCFPTGHKFIIIRKTFWASVPDAAIYFNSIIFLLNPAIYKKALVSINLIITPFWYKSQMFFFKMVSSKMFHTSRGDGHCLTKNIYSVMPFS
uniref:Uncharacterized protein n=1 Tax=Meloidogyne incognita TaxID=6306 RepID=A0A914LYD3_MELIC